MRRLVFAPLGMTAAGFGAPEGEQPRGHRRSPPDFATLGPVPSGPMGDNPAVNAPAGGVHLPLKDYAAFLSVFLGRPGFLSADSIARLTRPRSQGERPYALGWGARQTDWAEGLLLSHEGSNTLWHAAADVAPARGVALVAVANAGPRLSLVAAPVQPGDPPGATRMTAAPSQAPGPARVLLEKLKAQSA
jgi:CubicO group peptidase (beta-lactamase class C family)